MYLDASDEKCVILNLSRKISVNANNVAELYGRRSSILSFFAEDKNGGEKSYCSIFNHQDEICKHNGLVHNLKVN